MPNSNGWTAIERAAREQAQADVLAAESETLVPGSHIAWAESIAYGRTDGFSLMHRVMEQDRTFCDEPIPEAKLRVPPGLKLPLCRFCEKAYGEGRGAITPPALSPSKVA